MTSISVCSNSPLKRVSRSMMALVIAVAGNGATPRYVCADDADQLIKVSDETAKKLAESAFYQFVLQSMMTVTPWATVLANVQTAERNWSKVADSNYIANQNEMRKSVNKLAHEFERVQDLIDSNRLNTEAIRSALNSYLENYNNVIVQSRSLVDRVEDNEALAKMAAKSVTQVLRDINEMCAKGVAISFSAPHLVPLKFSNAASKISGRIYIRSSTGDQPSTTSGEVESNDDQNGYGLQLFPIGSFIDPDHGAEWSAGLSYATLIGTFALLATYGSLSTSMAMFYASGITMVIAVVVLLITEAMVRNQSRDAADDVQRAFFNRANAMTVATHVQNMCRGSQKDLNDIPGVVKELRAAGPDSPLAKQYQFRRTAATATVTKLRDLAQAAQKQKENGGGEGSNEAKEFNDFVKSLLTCH
jgi:hypothetical protein